MLQGPNGTGLDQVYNPEQNANGAENLTDSQYDMLHVRLSELVIAHGTRHLTPTAVTVRWQCALPEHWYRRNSTHNQPNHDVSH